MPFDIELTSWNGTPETLARILTIDEVEAEMLTMSLPAMAGRGVVDDDAERLFHRLTEAGATVKLHAVRPSRRPSGASSPPTAEPPPAPLPQSGSSRPPRPERSGSGEVKNQLDWQNTKIYWLWFGLAFIGLGIWMLADPDAMGDPDATRRRARGIKKLIQMGWSRPLGIGLIALGLFGGYTGMRDSDDVT